MISDRYRTGTIMVRRTVASSIATTTTRTTTKVKTFCHFICYCLFERLPECPDTMVVSVPSPPLDDPTLSDPLECPPLRWGMLGCGRVSHDFTQALKHLPTQSVVACSARSLDSAKAFAEKHGIQNFCKFDPSATGIEVGIFCELYISQIIILLVRWQLRRDGSKSRH